MYSAGKKNIKMLCTKIAQQCFIQKYQLLLNIIIILIINNYNK